MLVKFHMQFSVIDRHQTLNKQILTLIVNSKLKT